MRRERSDAQNAAEQRRAKPKAATLRPEEGAMGQRSEAQSDTHTQRSVAEQRRDAAWKVTMIQKLAISKAGGT